MEDARIDGSSDPGHWLAADVDIREDMGAEVFVHFSVQGPPVRGEDVPAAMGDEAVEATEGYLEPDRSVFVARVDRTSPAREGVRVELTVDTRRLHFFDVPTGESILR